MKQTTGTAWALTAWLLASCALSDQPGWSPATHVQDISAGGAALDTAMLEKIQRLVAQEHWTSAERDQASAAFHALNEQLTELPYTQQRNDPRWQALTLRWKLVLRLGLSAKLVRPRLRLTPSLPELQQHVQGLGLQVVIEDSGKDYAQAALQHLVAVLEHMPPRMRHQLNGLPVVLSDEHGGPQSTRFDLTDQAVYLTRWSFLFPETLRDAEQPGGHYLAEGMDFDGHFPTPEVLIFHELCHAWQFRAGWQEAQHWFSTTGWQIPREIQSFLDFFGARNRPQLAPESPTVSAFARVHPTEDFAESGMYFRYLPAKLQQRSPERYAYLRRVWD